MARGARGRGADKKKRGRKGWSENERAAHEKASQRMNDAKAAKEAEQAKAKQKEAKKRKNAFTNLLFGRNDADDSEASSPHPHPSRGMGTQPANP